MNSIDFYNKIKELNKINNYANETEQNLLYALYYQSTIGNINIPLNNNSRISYDKLIIWNKLKNMSKEDAEEKFLLNINQIFKKYNIN